MASPQGRTREDHLTELRRLQMMYDKLPPEKQKTNRVHMQKRMDELNSLINGKPAKSASAGMGMVQMILLVVLASVVALGAGFFGVSYLAK